MSKSASRRPAALPEPISPRSPLFGMDDLPDHDVGWGYHFSPGTQDDLYTPLPLAERIDIAAFYMPMASGRSWPILAPQPSDVHWPDIAEALSKEARFTGATANVFYSVAQHLCLCHDHVFHEFRAPALHHDDHEFVIRDMSSPVKAAMKALGGGTAYGRLREIQDRAIHGAAGIEWPLGAEAAAAVHEIDMAMLATEARDLMINGSGIWRPETLPPPLPIRIAPWPWPRAADEWLTRVRRHLPR